MNKNKKVALVNYDENAYSFTDIIELYEVEYGPLGVFRSRMKKKDIMIQNLNQWFLNRQIPVSREGYPNLIDSFQINNISNQIMEHYALSLSDQYWFKEKDQTIGWEDINKFDHDFEFSYFTDVSINEKKIKEHFDQSPNFSVNGNLRKAWIIENNKRYLLKVGLNYCGNQEAFNEYLASKFAKSLGIYCVDYDVVYYKNHIASKCECFIDKDTEYICAKDILKQVDKPENISNYEFYIQLLEQNGIQEARKQIEGMLIVDYLMMNIDRHRNNFGIIRNVETLQWKCVAPLFDTGTSLNCMERYLKTSLFEKGSTNKFFNESISFDAMLEYVHDFSNVNIQNLYEIVDSWKELLLEWNQKDDFMTVEDIGILVTGVQRRIQMLEKRINQKV